jgi:hypothetical protein
MSTIPLSFLGCAGVISTLEHAVFVDFEVELVA